MWRWSYSFDGKQKGMAFGAWPKVSLAQARLKRDEALAMPEGMRDPAIAKKLKKEEALEASRQTFERVARQWYENARSQWASVHAADVIRSLERDVFPTIGTPITSTIAMPAPTMRRRSCAMPSTGTLSQRI